MKKPTDAQRIPKIVDDLAEKLYYHNYLISRTEAEELGLRVVRPSTTLEKLLWELYLNYEAEMDLGRPFEPFVHLRGDQSEAEVEKPIALIESRGLRSTIRKRVQIKRPPTAPGGPPGPQIAIQEQVVAWETTEIAEE